MIFSGQAKLLDLTDDIIISNNINIEENIDFLTKLIFAFSNINMDDLRDNIIIKLDPTSNGLISRNYSSILSTLLHTPLVLIDEQFQPVRFVPS